VLYRIDRAEICSAKFLLRSQLRAARVDVSHSGVYVRSEMEDAVQNIGTGTLPRERMVSKRHWILFALLLSLAFLVSAAAHTEWASPAGFIFVPAIVGYFIVRRGMAARNLSARYAVFAVLLALLVTVDVNRASDYAEGSVRNGCLTNNPWVAQLTRDEDRQSFCGCISERMTWPVMRTAGIAFLTLREPTSPVDDPEMMALGSLVANQCAAALPAS
jgi:hypothetical protein